MRRLVQTSLVALSLMLWIGTYLQPRWRDLRWRGTPEHHEQRELRRKQPEATRRILRHGRKPSRLTELR